jgi:hypothetical protein
LQKKVHEEEMAKRKLERELTRYKELKSKEHLSSTERKRFDELTASLKEKGIII